MNRKTDDTVSCGQQFDFGHQAPAKSLPLLLRHDGDQPDDRQPLAPKIEADRTDGGAIPAARAIHILLGACQSLTEAHEAGLLHRDIKPANIFVSRAADEVDIVKVLDFGIVQAIGEPTADPADIISLPAVDAALAPTTKLTRDGAMVGTPGYIPPEQAAGERIDARSDIYALGCVAWWLLAGREVFARPDDATALRLHAEAPVPSLRAAVKGWLPVELELLVEAMLAKEPEDRPASARQLALALRRLPIPADHAWTQDRAHLWWAMNLPLVSPTAERAPADVATVTVAL